MPHADAMVVIAAPIHDVFAFLADGTNNPAWRPGVMDITPPESGPAAGAVYGQGLRGPKGNRFDGDYRITEYAPTSRLAFEVIAGPARPTGVFELSEPVPGATTVKFALDLQPRGLMKIPMKLAAGQIEKQMRAEVACLGKLKELLEVGEAQEPATQAEAPATQAEAPATQAEAPAPEAEPAADPE